MPAEIILRWFGRARGADGLARSRCNLTEAELNFAAQSSLGEFLPIVRIECGSLHGRIKYSRLTQ